MPTDPVRKADKIKFTNEQKIAHAEIRAAITNLVYACNHNKCALVGFVFGAEPPMMIRFGNIKEEGPDLTALLLQLSDLADEMENEGRVVDDPIRPES